MSLPWVAGSVRARLLATHMLGPVRIHEAATASDWDAALAVLAQSSYGREVRAGQTLEDAEHCVAATVLWQLRVLAGWLPASGAEAVRAMAAWFEIANVESRLATLSGAPARPPFRLGSLRSAWRQAEQAATPAMLRSALAASVWGDPGTDEAGSLRVALRARWAQRIERRVPAAAHWARAALALLAARELCAGRVEVVRGPAGALLPRPWRTVASLEALSDVLPGHLRWVLAGSHTSDDLWQAEQRWWTRVEDDATRMVHAAQSGPEVVTGAVALLALDARRLRGALATVARGAAVEGAADAPA
jgi:hypothetical protein